MPKNCHLKSFAGGPGVNAAACEYISTVAGTEGLSMGCEKISDPFANVELDLITMPEVPALFFIVSPTVRDVAGCIVKNVPEFTMRFLLVAKLVFKLTPVALEIIRLYTLLDNTRLFSMLCVELPLYCKEEFIP